MKIDLQRALFSRYPRAFRKSTGSGAIAANSDAPVGGNNPGPIDERGIECGDGWYGLIDRLAAHVEADISALNASGVSPVDWPRIVQIKEKLGTLRFYVFGSVSDDTRSQINEAVGQSESICENCGAPGELQRDGPARVSCKRCEVA